MKTFILLSISLSLVVVLAACNLPAGSSSTAQTTSQSQVGSAGMLTMQANPTQIQMAVVPATNIVPMGTTSPLSTPIPPNTPIWSVYNYTCELAVGGGTMTMNLAWTDRSNSEEGYKVYRSGQVIATLAPNSTSYIDVAYVATGKTLSYSVEAFNNDWRVSTSIINPSCQ